MLVSFPRDSPYAGAMKMRRSISLFVSALLAALAVPALAEKPRFGDTLTVAIGGLGNKAKASFSSTREDSVIDRLSLSDLGMDDKNDVFWADVSWQISERFRLAGNYSSFEANGFREVSEGGNFADLEWTANASLTSNFDMELFIVDLTWDPIKTDNAHLGVGLGLHIADLSFLLAAEGELIVNGTPIVSAEPRVETASVTAPLPNLSVAGGISFGKNLYLMGDLGYLSLKYDKYDGELISARGGLEWRPVRHFGLGAGYQYVDVDLKVDETDSEERYNVRFYGPVLFVSVGF
jgi:hypothetical protein